MFTNCQQHVVRDFSYYVAYYFWKRPPSTWRCRVCRDLNGERGICSFYSYRRVNCTATKYSEQKLQYWKENVNILIIRDFDRFTKLKKKSIVHQSINRLDCLDNCTKSCEKPFTNSKINVLLVFGENVCNLYDYCRNL